MAKKSLYVFLSSLLGVLLFLILDRLAVFFYFYLVAQGYLSASFDYLTFLAWDYYTMSLALLLGSWYGVWLGLHWFEKVYVEKTHGGFVSHVASNWFPSRPQKKLQVKMAVVKEKLENDLWQLEDLAKAEGVAALKPEPIKRTVVRKRAPKKLNSLK